MFKHRFSVLQGCVLLSCVATLQLLAAPSLAQEKGLTFEQAQTRTSYARRQLQAMQRELKDAEAREASALRRADELKKSYEQAITEAEKATQERQNAEEKVAQARARWSEESERLKRIHESRQ